MAWERVGGIVHQALMPWWLDALLHFWLNQLASVWEVVQKDSYSEMIIWAEAAAASVC